MAGRLAGQTINDRLLAAKHSIAGQGLAKSVCKATTEEMIGPKKKHLDYLVQCTNEPNVSIPQLANLLIERSQNTNWVVVYKALITVHHMMCYGNERFTQYLASSNSTFQLSSFLDKSGVQGMLSARTGYDMSPFIRRYARYLNEKALSYRTVAFDFCKKRGSNEDGQLRTMHTDKLLKTVPVLQSQLDGLLEFDCSANDLTNGVINMCFMLMFRDLIRLFACYNNGIINLLEKFFDMNKKQCREALDIYKKFLVRMDRVGEFLKVAENVGIDKGDIPDLTKAPSSLLEALEQHLAAVEGKKTSASSTPSQSVSNQKNVRSAVSALSSTSSSFGTVVANGRFDAPTNGVDEILKLQILAEEEAAMNQFKTKVQSPVSTANNPFFTSNGNHSIPQAQPTATVDLFAPELRAAPQQRPSDDLLQLSNPFADVFSQPQTTTAPSNSNAFQLPVLQQPPNVNAWVTNGNAGHLSSSYKGQTTNVNTPHLENSIDTFNKLHSIYRLTTINTSKGYNTATTPQNGSFVPDSAFQSVFGNTEVKTADGTAQPQSFNPFLVDDPEPSLLLDSDSPTSSKCKPIQDVISYFQKENTIDTDLNETRSIDTCKSDDKITVDESLSLSAIDLPNTDIKKAPPRPPPPMKKSSIKSSTSSPIDNNPNPNNTLTANEDLPNLSQVIGTGFDALGGVLQPTSLQGHSTQQVMHQTSNSNNQQSSALLTGDLESSLASLAENLSINSRLPPVKEIQWNSPKNGSKVGSSWAPQPISATTGAGYKPMNQAMASTQPVGQQQIFPQMQPMMAMRPMVANPMLPQGNPAANPMSPQQSLLFH